MYARKYGKRYGRRKAIRKRMYKRRPKVSKVVKRYVNRIVHRSIENKTLVNYSANVGIMTGDRNTMTWPLLIASTQGTSEEGRIGNSIKVTKGVWNMCINILPYNATTNNVPIPVWIKCWIVKDMRLRAQQTSIDGLNFAEFFRYGATPAPFQNTPLDICAPVNTDAFRVLHTRTFKLGMSNVYGSTGGYYDNSPSAKRVVFNWGKYARSVLKYDEASTRCANNNLYLVIQAVSADGQSCTNKTMVEMHYTNTMLFEDA